MRLITLKWTLNETITSWSIPNVTKFWLFKTWISKKNEKELTLPRTKKWYVWQYQSRLNPARSLQSNNLVRSNLDIALLLLNIGVKRIPFPLRICGVQGTPLSLKQKITLGKCVGYNACQTQIMRNLANSLFDFHSKMSDSESELKVKHRWTSFWSICAYKAYGWYLNHWKRLS